MKQPANSNAAIMTSDVDVLARTIWGEARGDGYEGMAAVANVVMNRYRDPRTWWGRTVREICLKPYQFSAWNEGDPNRDKMLAVTKSDPLFKMALEIAGRAVNGQLPDNTNGATHYHAKQVVPNWLGASEFVSADIGNHKFYVGVA